MDMDPWSEVCKMLQTNKYIIAGLIRYGCSHFQSKWSIGTYDAIQEYLYTKLIRSGDCFSPLSFLFGFVTQSRYYSMQINAFVDIMKVSPKGTTREFTHVHICEMTDAIKYRPLNAYQDV